MNIQQLLTDLQIVQRYFEDGEDDNAYEELCRVIVELGIIISIEEKQSSQATDEIRDCIPPEDEWNF